MAEVAEVAAQVVVAKAGVVEQARVLAAAVRARVVAARAAARAAVVRAVGASGVAGAAEGREAVATEGSTSLPHPGRSRRLQ